MAVVAASVFVALLPLGIGLILALGTEQEPALRRRQVAQQPAEHGRQGLGFVRGRRLH